MMRSLPLVLAIAWAQPVLCQAQEPSKPKAESNIEGDSAVLEVVLLDLFSCRNSPLGSKEEVFFSSEPATRPMGNAAVMFHDRYNKKWKLPEAELRLAREAAGDLVRRQEKKDNFKDLKLKDERIVVCDKKRADAENKSVCHQLFSAYPPGYSTDGQLAVVRMAFPWSIHQGDLTYILAKKAGKWTILSRDINIYL
jgi:hypothetical protein